MNSTGNVHIPESVLIVDISVLISNWFTAVNVMSIAGEKLQPNSHHELNSNIHNFLGCLQIITSYHWEKNSRIVFPLTTDVLTHHLYPRPGNSGASISRSYFFPLALSKFFPSSKWSEHLQIQISSRYHRKNRSTVRKEFWDLFTSLFSFGAFIKLIYMIYNRLHELPETCKRLVRDAK